MIDPVRMFQEGGPFQYLILLMAMVLPLVPVVAMGFSLGRIRVPLAGYAFTLTLPVAAGLLGTWMGAGMALEAVAFSSAEMKSVMAAMGFSIALYAVLFGAVVSAMGCAATALSMGLGTAIRPGEAAYFSPLLSVLPLLLLPVLLIVAVLGYPGLATISGISALGIALAGLRSTADAAHAPRVAATRVGIGTLGALGALSIGLFSSSGQLSYAYEALAQAAPEMRALLMAGAMDGFVLGLALPPVCALALLLCALVTAAPGIKHLFSPRSLGSAVLAAVAMLPLLGMAVLTGSSLWSLDAMTVPYGELRAEAREFGGVVLPRIEDDQAKRLTQGPTLQMGASEVRYMDQVVSPSTFAPTNTLVIEASGTTRLSELVPYLRKAAGANAQLAVRNGAGYSALSFVPLAGDGPIPKLPLEPQPGDWVEFDDRIEAATPQLYAFPSGGQWWVEQRGRTQRVEGVARREQVVPTLREIAAETLEDGAAVWFFPSDTVQDLADFLLEAGREEPPIWVHWRLDEPPQPMPTIEGG